jgi:hypothetical protein
MPGFILQASAAAAPSANEGYPATAPPGLMSAPTGERCSSCGGPIEKGFLSTTNGSGLYWAKEAVPSRLRPSGLEVLVPTGFMGTFSANAAAERCRACGTILVRTK